nr:DUF2218 domain-containing protein [uncultured Albidiferax sp.]
MSERPPMLTLHGRLPIAEPSRYMTRLCYHFTKKIEVVYDDFQGLARFPWGECRLTARDDAIEFDCQAEDAEKMAQVQHVIDAHVALFARRAPLSVAWGAVVQPPVALHSA